MSVAPLEINIAIRPEQRYELIDVTQRVREEAGDVLSGFRKTAYCSLLQRLEQQKQEARAQAEAPSSPAPAEAAPSAEVAVGEVAEEVAGLANVNEASGDHGKQ